jgi:hypothetical protein
MTTQFVRLNLDWNAEPNDPGEQIEQIGPEVRLSFSLNPWQYDAGEGERAELHFSDCSKWRLGPTNDEGWHRGQCRYSGVAPAWGEFYEIVGDDPLRDAPDDWREIGSTQRPQRHFLFYLRDQTFECIAAEWRLHRATPNVR